MGSNVPFLEISLLGGLRVQVAGADLALPASKKTRALFGYLVVTGTPQRRERLCDLLWDGPDDPRAELRWSISKLRPILNTDGATRLVADRDVVSFVPAEARVDLVEFRDLVGGAVERTPLAALAAAADRYRGEVLDGLNLPMCYRYQEWCMAERDAASQRHRAVLAELVRRLADEPERALDYARALVLADPLADEGHAAVIRLLGRLGRQREAAAHFERASRLFARELGVAPGEALVAARAAVGETAQVRLATPPWLGPGRQASFVQPLTIPAPAPLPGSSPRPAGPPAHLFIGRDDERHRFGEHLTAVLARRAVPVCLVTGEAGIGKSHLLAHVATAMRAQGGRAFAARGFEAEAARPYGVWVDLLRGILADQPTITIASGLGRLLPGHSAAAPVDQAQLLDAVVRLLRDAAAVRPTLITLDDLQWMDEASAALLHYVARHLDPAGGLLIALGGRSGELEDNAAVMSAIRSLRAAGRLVDVPLGAFSVAETGQLAAIVAPGCDAERLHVASGGVPLFAIELGRSLARGDDPAQTLDVLVAAQLARLHDHARDALAWAALLDRPFTPDDLVRIMGWEAIELLPCLGELERLGFIQPQPDGSYEFRHDLIRQATTRHFSMPRRTLAHRQIARACLAAGDDALAAEAAHHATLGNAHELAARACMLAGNRALRLFAYAEAQGFAERGARHARQLPAGPVQIELGVALCEIRVLDAMGSGCDPDSTLSEELGRLAVAAETHGLLPTATTAHYLRSVLYQQAGNRPQAARSTLRAATTGQALDAGARLHQLANTARCLLELESQLPRARELIAEAAAIAATLDREEGELEWAWGLLDAWDGRTQAAAVALQRATRLVRAHQDRRREYKCLMWLARLALERGDLAAGRRYATRVAALADKAGVETPFALTIHALADLKAVTAGVPPDLEPVLSQLRAIDDKSYLAYALTTAAEHLLGLGQRHPAEAFAREALAVAGVMQLANQILLAQVLLARLGDQVALATVNATFRQGYDRDQMSHGAWRAVTAVTGALPSLVPTLAAQATPNVIAAEGDE